MNKTDHVSESDLCSAIVGSCNNCGLRLNLIEDQPKPGMFLPIGKVSIEVPKSSAAKTIGFFEKEVRSFAKKLREYTSELDETLSFDLSDIFREVSKSSNSIAILGDSVTKGMPRSSIVLTKQIFRSILWPTLRRSHFVSKGLLKQSGHPGDYKIVESMYEGNARSLGIGYIYDSIFLGTQLCQGLRNRKDHMKQILSNYLKKKVKTNVKILNVACGGSRELRELTFLNGGEGIDLHLLDFDREALDFSVKQLKPILPKAAIRPINCDVRDITKRAGVSKGGLGKYDLIYSIGLFDYLPDIVLVQLIKNLASLLKKGGIFIFAHKDYSIYNPAMSDWFCNWKYHERTQQDFVKIFKGLGVQKADYSFSREKDGYIYFVQIKG